MRGTAEILSQADDFDVFVTPSGSGATHIGLLAGLRAGGSNALVLGSCVRRAKHLQQERLTRILHRLHDLDARSSAAQPKDITLWDQALAPGYGKTGPLAINAITMMAREEGLMLDPVYTAKAFAAIPAGVSSGQIAKGSKVCFLHTGGLAAMFAYEDVLSEALA